MAGLRRWRRENKSGFKPKKRRWWKPKKAAKKKESDEDDEDFVPTDLSD